MSSTNIVVSEGSPNQNGSSNFLAERFADDARESGHTVNIVDAVHTQIAPCTGCVSGGYEDPCVQKDDMEQIRAEILRADMMAVITPLYYYGMTAQ